jgi:hypothetical protein
VNKQKEVIERLQGDEASKSSEPFSPKLEMMDTELYLKTQLEFSELSKPVVIQSFSYQEDKFIDGYIDSEPMERRESPVMMTETAPAGQEDSTPTAQAPTQPTEEHPQEQIPARKESREAVKQEVPLQAIIPDRNDSMVNIVRQEVGKKEEGKHRLDSDTSQMSFSEHSKDTSTAEKGKGNYVVATTAQLEVSNVRVRKFESSNGSFLKFVFKARIGQQIVCYFEKGAPEFHQLEQRLRPTVPNFVQYVGRLPELSEFHPQSTHTKQLGLHLQNWLMSAMGMCPDHPLLLDFISTNLCPAPIIKESFRKSGYLTKKGNYFGGWKNRFYSVDVNTGTVYYADAHQGEVLGSFSLQYAYVVQYTPGNHQSKKDTDNPDKPGFVVTEYKKSMFNGPISFDQRNPDGLPMGKVDFRHVFYAESVQERDGWVRALSGLITKIRPEDPIAKYLFSQTVAPTLEPEIGTGSVESLSRKPSRQSLLVESKSEVHPQPGVSQAEQEWEKIQKNSMARPAENRFPSHSFPQSTPINGHSKSQSQLSNNAVESQSQSFPNQGLLAKASFESSKGQNSNPNTDPNGTITRSRQAPHVQVPEVSSATTATAPSSNSAYPPSVTTATAPEPSSESTPTEEAPARRPRPVGMQGSPAAVNRVSSRFVDDQTRCMQQPIPAIMSEELPLSSPTKQFPESKKKGNIFKDWMKKQNNDSPKSVRPIFGVSLQEAVQSSRIQEGLDIPAIVYRCIEYLDSKKGIIISH